MNEKENNIELEVNDEYKDVEVITDIIYKGKNDITLSDLEYMCRTNKLLNQTCDFCILNTGKHCFYSLLKKSIGGAANLKNEVLFWLNENPPTSYLMDVKVKMTGIPIDNIYHIPNICVKNLYGDKAPKCSCMNESEFSTSKIQCRRCWRTPMDKSLQKEENINKNEDSEIIDVEIID